MVNVWVIYTLELEDDCWYVGSTTTKAFSKRMNAHWSGSDKSSLWVRLHKPIKLQNIQTYERSLTLSDIAKLEDKRTLLLAEQYGYEYVRGGGYCQFLPQWPLSKRKKDKPKWDLVKAKRELRTSAWLVDNPNHISLYK